MTEDQGRIRFVEEGTLAPPLVLGRLMRLALGLASGFLIWNLITTGEGLVLERHLSGIPGWWLWIVLGVMIFPDVFNIGLGFTVPRRVLWGALASVSALSAVAGVVAFGSPIDAPLGAVAYVFLGYTFGHLGIALILAALISTPGCEMRSIPQLWGRVTGRGAKEHYCPGMFTPIDLWEARLRGRSAPGPG